MKASFGGIKETEMVGLVKVRPNPILFTKIYWHVFHPINKAISLSLDEVIHFSQIGFANHHFIYLSLFNNN